LDTERRSQTETKGFWNVRLEENLRCYTTRQNAECRHSEGIG